jgi:hypothetical protein
MKTLIHDCVLHSTRGDDLGCADCIGRHLELYKINVAIGDLEAEARKEERAGMTQDEIDCIDELPTRKSKA